MLEADELVESTPRRILKAEGNELHLAGLDSMDGSFVLDIKALLAAALRRLESKGSEVGRKNITGGGRRTLEVSTRWKVKLMKLINILKSMSYKILKPDEACRDYTRARKTTKKKPLEEFAGRREDEKFEEATKAIREQGRDWTWVETLKIMMIKPLASFPCALEATL